MLIQGPFQFLPDFWNHVNFGLNLSKRIRLDNNGNKLWDFKAKRMLKTVFLLKFSSFTKLFTCQCYITVFCCEDPSNSFEAKSSRNHIDYVTFRVFKFIDSFNVTHLWWFIDRFYVHSYAFRVIRILAVVSIEIANPLLVHSSFLPEPNKLTNFCFIHKWKIVNMPVFLLVEANSRRIALATRAFWIGQMVLTIVINLKALLRIPSAVLALGVTWRMSTPLPHLFDIWVKRNMLNQLIKALFLFFRCNLFFLFFDFWSNKFWGSVNHSRLLLNFSWLLLFLY